MDLDKKQVHQLNMMNEAARRSSLGDKLKILIDGGGGGEGSLPTGGTDGQVLTKVGDEDYISAWDNPVSIDNGLPVGGVQGQILVKSEDEDYAASWGDIPPVDGTLPSGGTDGQILKKSGNDNYVSIWGEPDEPSIPTIAEVLQSGNNIQRNSITSSETSGSITEGMSLNNTVLEFTTANPTREETFSTQLFTSGVGISHQYKEQGTSEITENLNVDTYRKGLYYDYNKQQIGTSFYDSQSITCSVNGITLSTENIESDTKSSNSSLRLKPGSINLSYVNPTNAFSLVIDENGIVHKNGLATQTTLSITPDNGLQGSQKMYDNMYAGMGTELQLRGNDAALTEQRYVAILPQGATLPDISSMNNGKGAVVTFTEANTGDVSLSFKLSTATTETTVLPIKNKQLAALSAGDIIANMTYILFLYKPNADNLTDAAWIVQI